MKENQIVQTGVGRKFQTPSVSSISRCSKISRFPIHAAAPCSLARLSARRRGARAGREVTEMIS